MASVEGLEWNSGGGSVEGWEGTVGEKIWCDVCDPPGA